MVLVAPAGLPVAISVLARISTTPWIGDLLTAWFGPFMLKKHVGKGYFGQEDPDLKESIRNVTRGIDSQIRQHPGYMPSLLSTTRYYPLNDLSEQITLMGEYLASAAYQKKAPPLKSKKNYL